MNTNIPIYRAKKIDSDEYAIGYLFQDFYNFKWFIHDSAQTDEVEMSTIETSFNHGQKWLKIHRVAKLMENQVNCTICNDKGINHNYQSRPNKYKSIPCDCGAKTEANR